MKNDFQEFVVYVEAKKFSRHYHLKILSHARKLSKSIYFFSYKELAKHRELLLKDAFFKSVRNICNFYEEKYLDDDEVLKELAKIRRLAKRKESGQPDVYTPTESELQTHLETIKGISHKVYNFYLGLMYSGVRVVEFGRWVDNPTAFRTIDMGDFVKILVNSKRGAKKCNYIYLPKFMVDEEYCSYKYLVRFCQEHKKLLRPKYLRNYFYAKCLRLGIPSGVADFFQGRSAKSIGDRHYLDKERMADEKYLSIIENDNLHP